MKEKRNLIIALLLLYFPAFSQTALNTDNGVKTSINNYTGDLNLNQSWGGKGMAGMYMFNATTTNHAPTSSDWYHMIEMQHDAGNNWTGQIALGYFTGGMYYRQQYSGNWGNWHTLATQDWVQSQLTGKLMATGNGTDNDAHGDVNGDLIVKSNTGSRNANKGAMLEFVVPANTDGTNLWGQARILTVAGTAASGDATGKMILGTRRWLNKSGSGFNWYYGDDIVIDGTGNVGIGTPRPTDRLTVGGTIGAREINVTTNAGADFVFEPGYNLPDLVELEKFVKTNKHLPEIPTAKEMVDKGINLGELNIKLLQKVEELTLHLIEKDKEIKMQNTIISNYGKRLSHLERNGQQKRNHHCK